MKKLLIATVVAVIATITNADTSWSWWMEKPTEKTDIAFGIASKYASVTSFELSALYSASPVAEGIQMSLIGINDSDSSCPLQLSWWFNRGKDPCVQLGMINLTKSVTLDLGFVNVANEGKFQIGFLNFNNKGFLPVFPFVNFDPKIFR